ncbi:betaine--homocysteine S-methyltransferase 1-like isoform X2 [Rhipicephalus microplus]|uniref:betaine--homocysteine S-methyltransferase 1-like isoform X2 n=1 Tax=Rhipicephalus microplus TaxID=6941 RepID=UPI003F6B0396
MTGGGLLERLDKSVVIGDGGFVFALEKRGYVKAGPWTPEAAVEHPEAVRQLHREFLRAGSDVMQAFTFYASDDKLINRGNLAGKNLTGADINAAACSLALEVAKEKDALVAGGISQTPSYLTGRPRAEVQDVFRRQVDVFVKNKLDFLICEYFEHVEEIEMAIEVCKKTGLPVVATMCIGPEGDMHGISTGDCAVRMVKAALEPRVCSRWDIQRYAREAYEMGVRYIGGCCGFEPYHVRAIAEELSAERGGKLPEASDKHDSWGEGLRMHTKPWVRARASRAYWENLRPSTGRPFSSAFSQPDNWGVTAGNEELKQQKEATSTEEIKKLQNLKK